MTQFRKSVFVAGFAVGILSLTGVTMAKSTVSHPATKHDTSPVTTKMDNQAEGSLAEALVKLQILNNGEIALGNLAMNKSKNAEIRDYGKMLVDDHNKANAKVAALAEEEKIDLKDEARTKTTINEGLKDKQKANMAHLKGLSGREFDLEFTKTMEQEHGDALNLIETYQKNIFEARAQNLFKELSPPLKKHQEQASRLSDILSKLSE